MLNQTEGNPIRISVQQGWNDQSVSHDEAAMTQVGCLMDSLCSHQSIHQSTIVCVLHSAASIMWLKAAMATACTLLDVYGLCM